MPMELTYLLAAEQLTVTANPLFPNMTWFTNSVLVTIIVTALVVFWARRSTAKMTLMPNGVQNLFEALVETLYITFEGIVGKHMIPKVFPLIATPVYFYPYCQLVWIGSGCRYDWIWRTRGGSVRSERGD